MSKNGDRICFIVFIFIFILECMIVSYHVPYFGTVIFFTLILILAFTARISQRGNSNKCPDCKFLNERSSIICINCGKKLQTFYQEVDTISENK
ncbi:MAG: hypothetical protein ACFFA0_13945 [Promethearchaeota archaeon]